MKSFESKELNYSLHNLSNYKKELDNIDMVSVSKKISELYIEYFKFITSHIKVKKSFNQYVIIRGLDTITNVFNFLLLYTKNVDLTYFHCQKSFYFYTEFVEQISEDEKMFLQLTTRDATTYVYKKTIFDINNDLRKNCENMNDLSRSNFEVINIYINIYKTILLKLIDNDFKDGTKLDIIETIYNKLNNLADKTNLTQISYLDTIIDILYYNINDMSLFFEISLVFVKKFSKKNNAFDNNVIQNIKHNILSDDFANKLNEPYDKIVAWLIEL